MPPRFSSGYAPSRAVEEVDQGGRILRVAILRGINDLTLTSNVSFDLVVGESGSAERPGHPWRLCLVGGDPSLRDRTGRRLSRVDFPVRFVPRNRAGFVIVNGSRYRGSLLVYRLRTGSYLVINEVGLEDYLRGVVPREVGPVGEDLIEAAKAQAVAARSYALSRVGRRAEEGYDLEADERDQVYGGVAAEWPLTDRAVSMTRGLVLVNHGKIVEALYHSTCGGRTADARELWGRQNVPYLRSIYDTAHHHRRARPFCEESPRFEWECRWRRDLFDRHVGSNLATVMGISRRTVGEVRSVRVAQRTSSGRVRTLEIVTTRGRHRLDGTQAMKVLSDPGSGRTVYSNFFDVRHHDSLVMIRGKGWGHGAGMCQWGARGMAKAGYRFDEILNHYYQGVRLARLPDGARR